MLKKKKGHIGAETVHMLLVLRCGEAGPPPLALEEDLYKRRRICTRQQWWVAARYYINKHTYETKEGVGNGGRRGDVLNVPKLRNWKP